MRLIMASIFMVSLFFGSVSLASASNLPSACGSLPAQDWANIVICNDATLKKLDQNMKAAFQTALPAVKDANARNDVIADHVVWLNSLSTCRSTSQTPHECLRGRYQDRLNLVEKGLLPSDRRAEKPREYVATESAIKGPDVPASPPKNVEAGPIDLTSPFSIETQTAPSEQAVKANNDAPQVEDDPGLDVSRASQSLALINAPAKPLPGGKSMARPVAYPAAQAEKQNDAAAPLASAKVETEAGAESKVESQIMPEEAADIIKAANPAPAKATDSKSLQIDKTDKPVTLAALDRELNRIADNIAIGNTDSDTLAGAASAFEFYRDAECRWLSDRAGQSISMEECKISITQKRIAHLKATGAQIPAKP